MAMNPFSFSFSNSPINQRRQQAVSNMQSRFQNSIAQHNRLASQAQRPPIMSMQQPARQPPALPPSSERSPNNPYFNFSPTMTTQNPSGTTSVSDKRPGMIDAVEWAQKRIQKEQARVNAENQKRKLEYIQSVKPFVPEFESRYGQQATAPAGYLEQVSGAKYDPLKLKVDRSFYETLARAPHTMIEDPDSPFAGRGAGFRPGFGQPGFNPWAEQAGNQFLSSLNR
jgi:hypothetical protein